MNIDNIPNSLKKYNQWIGWVFEPTAQGKKTKIPKHIVNGYGASSKKPEDWVNFETCLKYMHNFDGIGFVPTKADPFVLWDLDDCYSISNARLSAIANEIKNCLNSYTEYSPSGKGIRIIVEGTIGPFGRRNRTDKIEVYDSKQYLTITGDHLPGTPKQIQTRHEICAELHEKYLKKQIKNLIETSKKNRLKWSAYKSGARKLFS